MPNTDLNILVVDDAKFSAAVVTRTITQGGYANVRHASSADDALRQLEEQPADLLIADWLMPEMDGLELTQRVRQHDEAANRYTYIILLTAKEGSDALREAFDEGVDDFVTKSAMNEQLLHRVMAADRLVTMQNKALAENQRLLDAVARLRKQTLLDPLTGFGNRQYSLKRLDDALRQAASRGGAACLLLLRIENLQDMEKRLGKSLARQVVLAFSRRLRQLVRPMDVLGRITPEQFCLITLQPDLDRCTPGSFRRIHDGLNHRAFKTSGGFHGVDVSISMCSTDEHPENGAEKMLEAASRALDESRSLQRITETRP